MGKDTAGHRNGKYGFHSAVGTYEISINSCIAENDAANRKHLKIWFHGATKTLEPDAKSHVTGIDTSNLAVSVIPLGHPIGISDGNWEGMMI